MPRDASEKAQARLDANKRARQKARAENKIHLAKALGFVAKGKMTEEQKDEWLFERLAGTEKLQYENRVLKLREKLINEKGSDAFLVREAQQETRKMTVTAQAYANYYEGLNHNFSLIFNQSNHVTDGAYLARQGFEWPTTVSSQSYFTILAAITASVDYLLDLLLPPRIYETANLYFIRIVEGIMLKHLEGGKQWIRLVGY